MCLPASMPLLSKYNKKGSESILLLGSSNADIESLSTDLSGYDTVVLPEVAKWVEVRRED
jgi:hypothetical protein